MLHVNQPPVDTLRSSGSSRCIRSMMYVGISTDCWSRRLTSTFTSSFSRGVKVVQQLRADGANAPIYAKASFRKIALFLHRHPSTIAHEVKEKRTFLPGSYYPHNSVRNALCGYFFFAAHSEHLEIFQIFANISLRKGRRTHG